MVAPSYLWSRQADRSAPVLCTTTDMRRWDAWHLNRKELVIGRDPEADLVIDASSVSRYHARLIHNDGLVELEDLLSSNGSFYEGQPASSFQLKSGDSFRLGSVLCMYTTDPLRAVLPDGRRVAYLVQRLLRDHANSVTPDALTTIFAPGTTTFDRAQIERLMTQQAICNTGMLIAEKTGKRWRLGAQRHRFGWRTEIPVGGWAFGGWTGHGHGAVIEWTGTRHTIRTTAYFASMKINGQEQPQRRLRHGDRITISGRAFRYLAR